MLGHVNIFQEISLLKKLNGPLNQLQKEMGMKISTNMILQVLATAAQLMNAVSPMLPDKTKILLAGIIAGLQTMVSAVGHYSTPNGDSINAEGDIKK